MELADFLVEMVQKQASDLFISVDAPPMVNVEGAMTALNDQPIDEAAAHTLIRSILDENQLRDYEKDLELNIAPQAPDAGRFRVNLFYQRGATAAVCRYIRDEILSVGELGLPEKLNEIMKTRSSSSTATARRWSTSGKSGSTRIPTKMRSKMHYAKRRT